MTEDSFLTIADKSEGVYKEKGSKFLAFAYPVTSEREVKEILVQLKKDYYDARHLCYAFILGREKNSFRAYDDGEPAHTAGDPILNQIRSAGITNVLLTVVRYFGGTKLGKPGLIRAYKEAAHAALRNAKIAEGFEEDTLTLKFPYAATTEVMTALDQLNAIILEQQYDLDCQLMCRIRKTRVEEAEAVLSQYLQV